MRNTLAARIVLSTLASLLSWGAAGAARAQIVTTQSMQMLDVPPDPCVSTVISQHRILTHDLDPPSGQEDVTAGIRIYLEGSGGPRPVVLIVNGNGFDQSDYADLARYLARQGFIAAVAQRPHGVVYEWDTFVLDSLAAVLDHLGLPHDTPAALLGHSFGGNFVLDAAAQNTAVGAGFAIRAVVGLAPTILDDTAGVTGEDVDGLLLIYGSQDNDVEGLGTDANDAFAVYDRAGTESSTTCHAPLCWFSPQLDKRMLFIHGADHAGLVNQDAQCQYFPCEFPFAAYLSKQDQFCIAKGYTNAFLRYHLNGETMYERMLEDRYRPPSIAGITSTEADAQGNPPGTPLCMAMQQSPAARSVIENFEDQAWTITDRTPLVDVSLIAPGALIGPPENVRHVTHLASVSWPQQATWQLVGFAVPASRRDVRNFSRLALRVGQLWPGASSARENPAGAWQSVLLGLSDGTHSSWQWPHGWSGIPPNDFRPDSDYTHSVMNTVAVPLTAFSGIDKSTIQTVLLAFPAGSQGTLIIDSLEWFKE
jgi:pimeloyl-ACP methyl ester carboxylesterase